MPAIGIGEFVNIAHRGASGHAPENSVTACERAVAMGADFIELDVRRTRDGFIVAFHDETLDRTTDGAGPFAGISRAELQALDAGSWFRAAPGEPEAADFTGTRVATLAELAAALGDVAGLYIEAKGPAEQPGIERDLVAALQAQGLLQRGRAVLQAFHADSLHAYRALAPDIPRVQLLEYLPDGRGGLREKNGLTPAPDRVSAHDFAAIAEYADGVGPNHAPGGSVRRDADFVAAAHAAGLFVHVYTVDDPHEMRRLIAAGVDGIFTNFPDRLAAVRAAASATADATPRR